VQSLQELQIDPNPKHVQLDYTLYQPELIVAYLVLKNALIISTRWKQGNTRTALSSSSLSDLPLNYIFIFTMKQGKLDLLSNGFGPADVLGAKSTDESVSQSNRVVGRVRFSLTSQFFSSGLLKIRCQFCQHFLQGLKSKQRTLGKYSFQQRVK